MPSWVVMLRSYISQQLLIVATALSIVLTQLVGAQEGNSVPTISKQTLIIDVRSRAEWDIGHLQNAQWIPWRQIVAGVDDLEVPKDRQILLYCASGVRSAKAEKALLDEGYQNINNLFSLENAAIVTKQSIVH